MLYSRYDDGIRLAFFKTRLVEATMSDGEVLEMNRARGVDKSKETE